MIPIRSNANTIINENSPSDARLLLAYYNLEQYPETHLFYGPMYSDMFAGQDPEAPYKDDKPKYERDYKTGKYVVVNNWKNADLSPNSNHLGFLPRMWSAENAENYMKLSGVLNFSLKKEYAGDKKIRDIASKLKTDFISGNIDEREYIKFLKQFQEYIDVKKPSFWQNMHYFFTYQIGYMYWRYFMWNFTGRQDDIQGEMNNHGNWISGIKFLDESRLGSQDKLPSDVKNNKARNTYYFLPFILGVLGVYYQWKKSRQQFWCIFMLFIFTGIALKLYLNERPFEPRERDYALVGSFYVFAIWIGIGVFAVYEKVRNGLNFTLLPGFTVLASLLAVPVVMAYQNWDDHDRSDRYMAQSIAKAYLDSVEKDVGAMLYTIGDNDTFALWYAQQVEHYRTDVRTINTSLLARGWYIDQMKRKAYESEPVPSLLTHNLYTYGNRDVIYYKGLTESRWDIKDFMSWIASNDEKTRIKFPNGQKVLFYPTNKIRVPVNRENVLKSGLVKPKDSALIVDHIDINLPESVLTKNRMMMLDILANNNWERPIYFTGGSFDKAEYIWMKDYLQLEGLVYKLVPIKTPIKKTNPYQMGRIDADKMYGIVTRWEWGNSNSPDIYHDPETRKNSISYRGNIARLADQLIKENKQDSARVVLNIAMHNMPVAYFGFYSLLDEFVKNYYRIEDVKMARQIFSKISSKYRETLYYYSTLDPSTVDESYVEIVTNMERYRNLLDIVVDNDTNKTYKEQQIGLFNEQIDMMNYIYSEEERYDFEDKVKKDSLGLIK
ncbi:PMT family glycosyltransferase, 4-amino-4-deoxy-L-arabinose transferase [Elysia marginata]|uniref:PMT family glycosyltransferase, 4-amino-4-deoxy-L-arabinose transferase n=1 Tax=Elysia marginata TaxID=1093978 RepID=A0AAV4GKK8_9GAST|nr:PMT family glycosyltransferase, 4-amino-4-deoxy-L-arabinose transferase [Elysia marginata]